MPKAAVLIAVAHALLCLTIGLTWLFGPYGLIGLGVALGAAALLIDIKDSDAPTPRPTPRAK